jgi:hypothetical protein
VLPGAVIFLRKLHLIIAGCKLNGTILELIRKDIWALALWLDSLVVRLETEFRECGEWLELWGLVLYIRLH